MEIVDYCCGDCETPRDLAKHIATLISGAFDVFLSIQGYGTEHRVCKFMSLSADSVRYRCKRQCADKLAMFCQLMKCFDLMEAVQLAAQSPLTQLPVREITARTYMTLILPFTARSLVDWHADAHAMYLWS